MRALSMRTQAIHAGDRGHSVAPPLEMANSYLVDPDVGFSAEDLDDDSPFIYSRWGNPTVRRLEVRLAALEGGEAALCFGSGMSAITGLFTHLLGQGDHLVMSDVAYAGAVEYTHDLLPQMGVEVTHVNASNLAEIRSALRANTRLVHIETPCNPILRLADIRAVCEIAHEAGALVSVDSTFATPVVTRPLELGADFVLHSLTKYLGGHGDAIGGALIGARAPVEAVRQRIGVHAGGVLSPFNAWLILRGLSTLTLRMQAHSESAAQVAALLAEHPRVTRLHYPGLPSHPQHALALRQMRLFSGMLTFQVEDGLATARQLQQNLRVFSYAVSLGDVRSLIFYIDTEAMMDSTFHLQGTALEAYRAFAGHGVFRVSVGLEDPGDLCHDLEQALR